MSFAARDYKVRYAQTYLGYWWSLLQPIASLAVLFLVFQKMIKVPTHNIPYLPFTLSGLILWNYFYYVITQSASSLVLAQNMIRRIYFPRLSLPLSRTLVGLIEPCIGFILLTALLLAGQRFFSWELIFFPVAVLFTAFAAIGIGLWTSALSIRYRDLQQILPFALQILFFITPVAYSDQLLKAIIPENLLFLLYFNPMVGIIESFRSFLFDIPFNSLGLISYGMGCLLFLSGLRYFQRTEMKMADIV